MSLDARKRAYFVGKAASQLPLGYAGQIFSFALDKNYVRENPVSKIKKFKELSNPDGSDEIKNHVLSAGVTEKLFRAAQPDLEIIPFLALWFFAGIRRTTLENSITQLPRCDN